MRALKVLILEDSPFQLMTVHQMLNACGVFDVIPAESVAGAYRSLANKGPVDIAICDLQMEGENGLDMIRHLGRTGDARAVIILSCAQRSVLDEAARLAQHEGLWVLGALSKPVSCCVLHQLLDTYRDNILPMAQPLPLPEVHELFNVGGLADYSLAELLPQWVMYYQPKVNLEGDLLAVEAEIRWQHPHLGLLGPTSFLPLAEYAGFGEGLAWHMIDQALSFSVAMREREGRAMSIEVSLPASAVDQEGFYLRVHREIAKRSLPAGILQLYTASLDPRQPIPSSVRQSYQAAMPMTHGVFFDWYEQQEAVQLRTL